VRGRGLSEAVHARLRLDACARDLIALAEALGLATPTSWAIRWARAMRSAPAGSTVRALAGSCWSIRRCRGRGAGLIPRACPGISIDGAGAAGAGLETLRPFTPTWTDEQIALRAQWLHTCDQAAILSSFVGFHEDDIHGDLPALTQPALLVSAERGDVVRDEDVAEFQSLAPQLGHLRVAGAGHMIPGTTSRASWPPCVPFWARNKALLPYSFGDRT
jgi:N-formylmaleamate deformylase